MKKIEDNYLFVSSQKDVNYKTIKIFWQRLLMFLSYNVDRDPGVVFTSDPIKWKKHSSGERVRCLYDEDSEKIVFWANDYLLDSNKIKNKIPKDTIEYAREAGYNYIIPLTDIYHELIHHVQYFSIDWANDDFLEATAELFTYMLTAQRADEYAEQCIALWYIGRKMLKMSHWQFYIFIRDAIIDDDFYYYNKKLIKLIVNKYNGSVKKLLSDMTRKYGKLKYKEEMFSDLDRIHTQIFYHW